MIQFTRLSNRALSVIATIAVLFLSGTSFSQKAASPQAGPLRPNLGTAATYALFTGGGAINNTGPSQLTGDVGQDGAYAFNGFPPGTYSGTLNRNNGASALAKSDLLTAWTTQAAVPCGFVLGVGIVDGQSFDPAVYCSGAASTTTGNITFDAHGDGTAIFIVKIGGQLDANAGTHILLANKAQAGNIYWLVDGAVNIADNSSFKGTIFARGAITFHGTSTLEGRALTAPLGAITIASNIMSVPVDNNGGPVANLIVVRPAKGDTVKGATQNYKITWTGSGIDQKKTLDYSLDSGLTWTKIGDFTSDGFLYNWNVPDTSSMKAIVRITDKNTLTGRSGLFTISSSKPNKGTIAILTPSAGEIVVGKTQNYQISWTGQGIASQKKLDLSLDGGVTWTLIGTMTADAFTYSWNVPDTSTTSGVVRITDANGAIGKSGVFIIKSSSSGAGRIVLVYPVTGEVIAGGTQNFIISWTGSNIAKSKTFEYSLDGGATWNFIGILNGDEMTYTWTTVPNEATTQALVRITDDNHISGTSGMFSITKTAGIGSINSITLMGLDNKNNIGNAKQLGISWTFTPDIGAAVEVQYSLDYTATWAHIATVATNGDPSKTWTTTAIGYYNPVFIRLTSSNGTTRTSGPFSIGSNASVSFASQKDGYSLSNYPNPSSGQTNIVFVIPEASAVSISIRNALGFEVATIASKYFEAGSHTIPFNTSVLGEGFYNFTLRAGLTTIVGRMIVVK